MTNDLISRSALLNEFVDNGFLLESIVRLTIEAAPDVDAIEVVRCVGCAHWGKSPLGHSEEMLGWCKIAGEHHKPDYYCASGRRKA